MTDTQIAYTAADGKLRTRKVLSDLDNGDIFYVYDPETVAAFTAISDELTKGRFQTVEFSVDSTLGSGSTVTSRFTTVTDLAGSSDMVVTVKNSSTIGTLDGVAVRTSPILGDSLYLADDAINNTELTTKNQRNSGNLSRLTKNFTVTSNLVLVSLNINCVRTVRFDVVSSGGAVPVVTAYLE